MENRSKGSSVRTSETTFEVIDAIVELNGAGMDEIANYLNISPSTAHRHLKTLQKHGYIIKRGKIFEISFRFLSLGGHARGRKNEFRLAEEYVEELAEKTQERSQFVVEENGERVFIFRRVGENAVRGDANIGKRGPLHCSAAGKAILAEFSHEKVKQIIDEHGLESLTDRTINDIKELFTELEEIRDLGYAVNREESAKGFHAVGVSINNPAGSVIGAISVSGPAHRMNEQQMENEIPELVMGTAQELELKIEYM